MSDRAEYKRNRAACVTRAARYKKTERGRTVDRNWRLKKLYGLTGETWERAFASQGGLCALCRIAPIKHTDHDHASGKFRALLCHGCNIGLGAFRDSSLLLRQAAMYLEGFSIKSQPRL